MSLRPRHLIIPMAVTYNTKLQPLDREVYGVIYWFSKMSKEKCVASNEMIAGVMTYGERKVNPKSVSNSVSRLEKAGCVQVLLKPNKQRIEIIPLIKDELLPDEELVCETLPSNDGRTTDNLHPSTDGTIQDNTVTDPSDDGRTITYDNFVPLNDGALFHQMMADDPSNDGQNKNIEKQEINNIISSYEELEKFTNEVFGVSDDPREKETTSIPEEAVHVESVEPTNKTPDQGETAKVFQGEVMQITKIGKPAKPKRQPNADGSYGDPSINTVQKYFLETMNLPCEDGCTRDQSRNFWSSLLNAVQPGYDKVEGVKKLIDIAKQDAQLGPNITSSKDLWYKRVKLVTRYRARKTGNGLQTNTSSKANYGNIRGGVAW